MYHVDWNLRRLAALTIAKELWKYSALKKTLKDCIDREVDPKVKLSDCVSAVLSQLFVPQPVAEELKFVLGMMGREICDFQSKFYNAYHGTCQEGLPRSVCQPESGIWVNYIRWTYYGRVDYAETMRTLYVSNILPIAYLTFVEICRCCLKDCIIDILSKQPRMMGVVHSLSHNHIHGNFKSSLMLATCWISRIKCAQLSKIVFMPLTMLLKLHDNRHMFVYSFINNQDIAVEYFWELMSDYDRKLAIVYICGKILADHGDDDDDDEFDYGDGNTVAEDIKKLFFSHLPIHSRTLIFFLEQLSIYGYEEVRVKILRSGFVLSQLLDWPYYNSFMKNFEEALTYHKNIDFNPIIVRILTLISKCGEYQFVHRDVRYRKIFYEIWRKNPHDLKQSLRYSKLFYIMWLQEEIELISYILRDPDLFGRREEFLVAILDAYDPEDTCNNFLETFLADHLHSDEERRWFRKGIWIEYGEYGPRYLRDGDIFKPIDYCAHEVI